MRRNRGPATARSEAQPQTAGTADLTLLLRRVEGLAAAVQAMDTDHHRRMTRWWLAAAVAVGTAAVATAVFAAVLVTGGG